MFGGKLKKLFGKKDKEKKEKGSDNKEKKL